MVRIGTECTLAQDATLAKNASTNSGVRKRRHASERPDMPMRGRAAWLKGSHHQSNQCNPSKAERDVANLAIFRCTGDQDSKLVYTWNLEHGLGSSNTVLENRHQLECGVGCDGNAHGGQIESDHDQRPSGDLIYRLSTAARQASFMPAAS
jgi:hypothetical protein